MANAKFRAARPACSHEEGPLHDCAWVDFRESLIPVAEAAADARHPDPGPDATRGERHGWSLRWDAAFHREMERLARDPFRAAS